MKDRQFLIWLRDRLVNVYQEPSEVDFVGKLESIIMTIPPEQCTPNTGAILERSDLTGLPVPDGKGGIKYIYGDMK